MKNDMKNFKQIDQPFTVVSASPPFGFKLHIGLNPDKRSYIWVTISWRDIIPKTVLFFLQSLTVDFSYMVHCRDPIFFPVALNYL